MKVKAYEILIMLQFAIYLGDQERFRNIPYHEHLVMAAASAWDFYTALKDEPLVVPRASIQKLFDMMQSCLVRCERAHVHFVPKFHFSAHLAERTMGHRTTDRRRERGRWGMIARATKGEEDERASENARTHRFPAVFQVRPSEKTLGF